MRKRQISNAEPVNIMDGNPHMISPFCFQLNPPLVKLPKSRITAHLHSFIPLFPRLWNKPPHSVKSHSSLQAFKTAVHHHLLSSPIQILDLFYPRESTPNPPPSNSLLSFLKVPVMSILYTPYSPPHHAPFHRSPNVSVPHCFVFPSPTPLVSFPSCCVLCVSSHTSLDNAYKIEYI